MGLQQRDDTQALLIVQETGFRHELAVGGIERFFPRVTERRVTEVVGKGDGFRQILVELQGAGDRASDLRDFERMGEACTVMVFFGVDEHLRFVFEAAKRFRMQDTIAIALIGGSHRIGVFGAFASGGQRGFRRPRRQHIDFPLFLSFTRRGHY